MVENASKASKSSQIIKTNREKNYVSPSTTGKDTQLIGFRDGSTFVGHSLFSNDTEM